MYLKFTTRGEEGLKVSKMCKHIFYVRPIGSKNQNTLRWRTFKVYLAEFPEWGYCHPAPRLMPVLVAKVGVDWVHLRSAADEPTVGFRQLHQQFGDGAIRSRHRLPPPHPFPSDQVTK